MEEKRIEQKQKYGICDVIMRLSEKDFCVFAGVVALFVFGLACLVFGTMAGYVLANR